MAKLTGNVATKPERKEDGRWHLMVWKPDRTEEWSCVSSVQFETDNRAEPLELAPLVEVEMLGRVIGPNTFCFDFVRVLERAQ